MIISKLFDHNCMLRIRCKPMILITQTWLRTCLKVFKVSCCKLMYPLTLEVFACLKVWPLGHDGSVLLSVVTQAFLYNFLCAGSSSLLPAKPLTTVSGKSMLLCARFCNESRRRRRVAEGGLHL
jgi:hypothetical protein